MEAVRFLWNRTLEPASLFWMYSSTSPSTILCIRLEILPAVARGLVTVGDAERRRSHTSPVADLINTFFLPLLALTLPLAVRYLAPLRGPTARLVGCS